MSTSEHPVALVTGAGGGIGAACAASLARAGSDVVVADLDLDAARSVADQIARTTGRRTAAVLVDVSDPGSVADMVATTVEQLGRLDQAVNNAGIGAPHATVADLDLAHWHRTIDVDLHGVLYCLQSEIRAMRATGGGAIVNMASVMAVVARPGIAPYAAAKHAVIGLTRAAALDHAADGVRVNAVGPGFVRTPLFEATMSQDEQREIAALHPRGDVGTPEDVAALVTFLLGPTAANMTGGFHATDGGYTTQ